MSMAKHLAKRTIYLEEKMECNSIKTENISRKSASRN